MARLPAWFLSAILHFLFTGLLIVGGAIVLIVQAARAGAAFAALPSKVSAFESTYASVSAHIAEFVFWFCRHSYGVAKGGPQRVGRAIRAVAALLLAALILLIPVAAIVLAGAPNLSKQGLAVGIGGLVWSVALETASLRERTKRLSGGYLLLVPPWLWALLLCAGDAVVIAAAALCGHSDPAIAAAMIGAAFVAGADLVSTYVGFYLCAWTPYLLRDP